MKSIGAKLGEENKVNKDKNSMMGTLEVIC